MLKESIELSTDTLAVEVFGSMEQHLKQIERELPVSLGSRGRSLHIEGSKENIVLVKKNHSFSRATCQY